MYDVIIIGAGPAGLTAAIYAKRAMLNVLVFEDKNVGGQILSTYEIDNYPGMPGIGGMELGEKIKNHAKGMEIEIVDETVTSIEVSENSKIVHTNHASYETKNVILATGASHAKLGIEREDELIGAGISYCATCDGAFYKGADVAVVGGGDVAAEDAIYLSNICRKVYLIHRRDELRANKALCKKLEQCPNIEILWNTRVTSLNGEDELESVEITNDKNNTVDTLEIEGLFVAIGIVPQTGLVENLVELDDRGYVIAGEDCATNISGIFAAGDIRKKRLRQIVTAVADGANAVDALQI